MGDAFLFFTAYLWLPSGISELFSLKITHGPVLPRNLYLRKPSHVLEPGPLAPLSREALAISNIVPQSYWTYLGNATALKSSPSEIQSTLPLRTEALNLKHRGLRSWDPSKLMSKKGSAAFLSRRSRE